VDDTPHLLFLRYLLMHLFDGAYIQEAFKKTIPEEVITCYFSHLRKDTCKPLKYPKLG
jgi:hypothetical protein